jgi:hypothetical protein
MRFVLDDGVVFITLQFVDPLEADRVMTLWKVLERPCLVVVDRVHLLDDGCPPELALFYFSKRTQLLLIDGMQLGDV